MTRCGMTYVGDEEEGGGEVGRVERQGNKDEKEVRIPLLALLIYF